MKLKALLEPTPPHAPPRETYPPSGDEMEYLKGIPDINKEIPLHEDSINIDFEGIAKSSDFQRFIVYLVKKATPFFKGVPTRKSNKVMVQKFNQKLVDFGNVINEFKTKVKKIKNK